MKKVISATLILLSAGVLAACGSSSSSEGNANKSTSSSERKVPLTAKIGNYVGANAIEVTGKTEPKSSVFGNVSGFTGDTANATVDANGNYKITLKLKKEASTATIGAVRKGFSNQSVKVDLPAAKTTETMDVSAVKTNEQLATYIKADTDIAYLVKGVDTLDGVPVVRIQNIRKLSRPVVYEQLAKIIMYAAKTPMAAKGVGVVQTSEYKNGEGKVGDAMDFGFYFSKSSIQALNQNEFPHTVYSDPTQFYRTASGYYLQKQFVENVNYLPNTDLMKVDNDNIATQFMDKYGA